MEAIVQANKNLASRPSPRRAIVTLNLEPSDEQSIENANPIKDVLDFFGMTIDGDDTQIIPPGKEGRAFPNSP